MDGVPLFEAGATTVIPLEVVVLFTMFIVFLIAFGIERIHYLEMDYDRIL